MKKKKKRRKKMKNYCRQIGWGLYVWLKWICCCIYRCKNVILLFGFSRTRSISHTLFVLSKQIFATYFTYESHYARHFLEFICGCGWGGGGMWMSGMRFMRKCHIWLEYTTVSTQISKFYIEWGRWNKRHTNCKFHMNGKRSYCYLLMM